MNAKPLYDNLDISMVSSHIENPTTSHAHYCWAILSGPSEFLLGSIEAEEFCLRRCPRPGINQPGNISQPDECTVEDLSVPLFSWAPGSFEYP